MINSRLFVREGYWRLGWNDEEQPDQAKRRDQIRLGDGIAIKKRNTSNKRNIEIRAIGFVTGMDPEIKRIYIRWVASDLRHEITKGVRCFKSIHGPYPRGRRLDAKKRFNWNIWSIGKRSGDLPDLDDDVPLGQEGSRSWRLHLVIERNRKLVESKKAQARKEGAHSNVKHVNSISRIFTVSSVRISAKFTIGFRCLSSKRPCQSILMTWRSSAPTAIG